MFFTYFASFYSCSCRSCHLHPSCSQRSRCERADEPYRFAATLNQCVKATVYPDSIAVSEPSVPVSLHQRTSASSPRTPQPESQTPSLSTTTCAHTHRNEKSFSFFLLHLHICYPRTGTEDLEMIPRCSLPRLDCG